MNKLPRPKELHNCFKFWNTKYDKDNKTILWDFYVNKNRIINKHRYAFVYPNGKIYYAFKIK